MTRLTLAVAAMAVTTSTGALAQTVTTDCYSHKNRVHCRSSVTPSWSDTLGEIAAMAAASRERKAQRLIDEGQRQLTPEQLARAHPVLQTPDFDRMRVIQFISNKDCPGAHRFAAGTKNPATIARVVEFCGPATP